MISRNTINQLGKYLKSSNLIFPDQNEWLRANKRFSLHVLSPAAILEAKDWTDISTTIKYCNQNSIPFALKGGGVNQSSSCVRKDGLTIDLSEFKQISHRYNGKQLEITLGSGINFRHLYDYIQKFNKQENVGFITPLAWYEEISCIGAFCILGNGVVQRKIGVGVDLIKQAKVIISTGQIITANQRQNSDILWAIRGCGPHFGAILQITIELKKDIFDHLKKDVKNNLKVHSFAVPFAEKTMGIQKELLSFLNKMDPRVICYIGFNGNWKQANIYLVLSEVITNDVSQDRLHKQSQQGQKLAKLVKSYNGKNHFGEKQFIQCPLNGFLIPKTKEKYYKTWGFYATKLQFQEAVRKIFQFYLKNSINTQDKELVFNFAVNYFGCQIFDKRQSSKTCVPASQQETFLIYGHLSYFDITMEKAAEAMVEKLQQSLEGLMPLGSPCDYDPEKARKNPNIGKWIYRQNYQKLKEIKKKVDPSNRFDYGLFH